jgi:hypothetical protein
MAAFSTANIGELDRGWVLAPERYDPRRALKRRSGTDILAVARVVNEQTDARRATPARQYLVLDTGDAQDGVLHLNREPIPYSQIGSTKKIVHPGDVIISRLRPYLRQVALVDEGLLQALGRSVDVIGSTEFFVLRPVETGSIAFLVPFLLSTPVQAVLAAAQEGGHHPRFSQRMLESLCIPEQLMSRRLRTSALVERAVASARESELALRDLATECGRLQEDVQPGPADASDVDR